MVFHIAYRFGKDRHTFIVYLVPQNMAFDLAVVPGIGRHYVSIPAKVAHFKVVIWQAVLALPDLTLFIPCCGPIPEGLGGITPGIKGIMACCTGNVLGMFIEMLVQKLLTLVRHCGVTVLTGAAPFSHRQGEAPACNLVVSGLVAVLTLKTKAAHVDVTAAGVEIEKGI